MMPETLAYAVIILHSLFMVVKVYMTGKHTPQAATANNYPSHIGIFQGIHAFLLLVPYIWAFGYLHIDFLVLPLPQFIQWIGIPLYVLLIAGMIWQMRHLSVNISATHHDRFLVTTGPYKYVRHPLYLIFVLLMLNGLIFSGNILFIVAAIFAYSASKIRADYEEQLLLEEYGQQYHNYQEQTPQLIPRVTGIENESE